MHNILLIFIVCIFLVGLAIWCVLGLIWPKKVPPKFKSWARFKFLVITSIASILIIIIGVIVGVIINPADNKHEVIKVENTSEEKREEINSTIQNSSMSNVAITRSNYEKFASLELGDDFDFVTNLFGAQPIEQSVLPLKDTLSANLFELNDLKFTIICKNNKIISKELHGWDYSEYENSEDILERE